MRRRGPELGGAHLPALRPAAAPRPGATRPSNTRGLRRVTLGSGERVAADYIVLATGSTYPFPAKVDAEGSATGIAMLHAMHKELSGAERVLLLGAGPVGLELAGEITAQVKGENLMLDTFIELLGAPETPVRGHGSGHAPAAFTGSRLARRGRVP